MPPPVKLLSHSVTVTCNSIQRTLTFLEQHSVHTHGYQFEQGRDLHVRPGCPDLIERLGSGLLAFGNDMDARHSVLESGLGAFISLNFDIDSLCMDALRAERKAGPVRRLVAIAMDAPNGSLLLAGKPFISTEADKQDIQHHEADDLSGCTSIQE